MNGKITYHQQVSYCGKPRCRRCREGTGHGPYWYAYRTVDGRTTRTYIGKQLPPAAQAAMEGAQPAVSPFVSPLNKLEQIRMYTLGQFRLERRDESEWHTVTESAWQHQRVRVLLSCLVSNVGRKVAREPLLDAIWPELDIEAAGSRLDRAVHSLRQIFEPSRHKLATSPFLLTEREVLVLADQQHIWIDADAFEQLIALAHESPDQSEKERLFEEAITLYGGNFLPEERRIEAVLKRRESLQRSLASVLIELADLRIAREALPGAIEPLDRLLSLDPTNEGAVQRLMRVLAQLGRRGEALRAYKKLATVLQQEYKIAPLPETRALYAAVRASGGALSTERGRGPEISIPTSSMGAEASRPRTGTSSANELPTIQIGRTHQSPLVGRRHELEMLQGLLAKTEQASKFKLQGQKKLASSLALDTQRTPQCVLLMGEVGIGKTRLAEEIGREARQRGWLVAWSRVYAQESGIPYRLWIEVLRRALTTGILPRQEMSKRPLLYQPLTALLPELQTLLPQIDVPPSVPPEQEQLRLWEAARELLTNIAEGMPLLIVLDDLQWSDGSSCELLAYLARRIYGHPIIIVGTCRDNELPDSHPLRPLLIDLQRERAVETLSLEPLSNEQIGTLVTEIAKPVLRLPEPIVEHIQSRAAGNPFFAEELTRGVSSQEQDDTTPLPDSITAVLDLRLSHLSKPCQRLLSKAAVLGGSFAFSLIQEMEANTPGSDEDTVLDLLEEALQSGMLTEEGVGTRVTYLFWHPLLVSHLYEGLSAARRANLHRRAADILRRTYQQREEEGAAIITHHLLLGGADTQQIIHYAELAGDKAYALSAYPDAEKYYRIVVEQMESGGKEITSTEEQMHLAYLLEKLGECTRVQGKTEDARNFYERVLEIRSQTDASVNLQQEAQIQALLWCEIGWTWYGVGDNARTQQCYQRGEKVLRDAGVTAGSGWAKVRLQQSYVSWQEGNYEEAIHTSEEALRLFDEVLKKQNQNVEDVSNSTRIRRTLLGDPVDLGRTHALRGSLAIVVGQLTTAITELNQALALYEQHQQHKEIATVCCTLSDVYLRRAEYSLAQSSLRRSLNLAEQTGDIPLASVIFGNLGVLAIRLGDLAEAEICLKRGIRMAEQINDPVYRSVMHAYLSIVMQDQCKFSDAKMHICCALSVARSIRVSSCIGFALVALGSIYISRIMIVNDDAIHTNPSKERERLLRRTDTILQSVTDLEGIEAETRTEAQLMLAQVALLKGNLEDALQRAKQTLKNAEQYELTWLVARSQGVIGSILAASNKYEQANQYFEQALRTFQKRGMHLEYARTLRERSVSLLQRAGLAEREYQRAMKDLQDAHRVFMERGAELDRQIADHALKRYETVAVKRS